MKTIKEYLLENYTLDAIRDIDNNGCMSGTATTLIYYSDTCAFHDEYEDEIWDIVHENTQNEGEKNIFSFLALFNGANDVGSMEQFKNILTWFAVERVSNEIVNEADSIS